MERFLIPGLYDLISPDGQIVSYTQVNELEAKALVSIRDISPAFKGFEIDPTLVTFNIKSTLAQLGLDGIGLEYHLNKVELSAQIHVSLHAHGPLAKAVLQHLSKGQYIGKLFAADDRRKVQNPDYLLRMFNRNDRAGAPLLYLGDPLNSEHLILEKKEGETIAFLSLLEGTLHYNSYVQGFIPVLTKALEHPSFRLRSLLQLLQKWDENQPRTLQGSDILLVKTRPLHIRTAFARVKQNLLPKGFFHTSASVL